MEQLPLQLPTPKQSRSRESGGRRRASAGCLDFYSTGPSDSLSELGVGGWDLPLAHDHPFCPTSPRARDLGIAPGIGQPGALNAITDVAGVRVGHTTIVSGDTVRTGVTACCLTAATCFARRCPEPCSSATRSANSPAPRRSTSLGTIESPIVLTNTLAVGAALDATVRWTIGQSGNENVRSVNPLVGETNDGGLNDIRACT